MTSSAPEPVPDAASARARTWYPLLDAGGKDLVTSEIVEVILGEGEERVTQTEKEMRHAEVKRTLRQASDGQLSDGSWKPVSRDPELWELRWRWDDWSQLRGYFHEPPLDPGSTILAKVHRKQIIPRDDPETKRLQNASIDEAGIRIRSGKAHRWGLGRSNPLV